MSILILNRLGPNSKYMTNFTEWLSEYSEPIYMFTDVNFSNKFMGYSLVKGFNNYDSNGLVEVEAVKFGKGHSIKSIIALDERDLLRAARIRETLKIPGQTIKSAYAFRHKPTMKSYVKRAEILCPEYAVIASPIDLYEFILKNGFPIVVKPQDGFGSINTKVITTWKQVERLLEVNNLSNMMVETFVDGEMYHTDGLIMNGKVVFLSVGKYRNSLLKYQEGIGSLSELVSPKNKIFSRLDNFTKKVIESLPYPNNSSFHCEIFHTVNDELVFCEIASRTAGARIGECILQSYGVDLNAEWARLECGLSSFISENIHLKQLSASYLIPPKPGKLISMIDELPFPWVTEFQSRVKVGQVLRESKSSTDTLASVVFVGSSQTEINERFMKIFNFAQQNIKIEI